MRALRQDRSANCREPIGGWRTVGKPVAAAINGVCMGGGFELALACHYRVVSDGEKVRVGLPEIKVGLFPGGGGTQRVARLMQTGDALQMLFKGDQIKPAAAKAMGLVHEIAPAGEIVQRAKDWVKANPERQSALGRSKIQTAFRAACSRPPA